MDTTDLHSPPRRIVVTGGTGFVGRVVCERLGARWPGTPIVVPTRRLDAGVSVQTLPGVQLVRCDVHDAAQVATVLDGADVLVHLVAILHGDDAAFDRVHVQLVRTLAQAGAAAGVQRIVHVSALGVAGDAPSAYLRSKAAGEAVWRREAQAHGQMLAILRPSVIFGDDDRFTNLFASLLKLFPVMPLAGAQARFQPVWVGDVAQAVVEALVRAPSPDPVIECAGPDVMTLGEIIATVGAMSGRRRPVWPLPEWAGMAQATLMSLLPGQAPMSRDNLLSMRVPNVATGDHAGLAALGIVPRPLAAMAPHFAPTPAYRSF